MFARRRNGSQQEHALALVEKLQVEGDYGRRPGQPRQERRCRLHRRNQDHRHQGRTALASCRRLDGDSGCRNLVAAGRSLVDEFIVLLVLCLLRTTRCIRRAAWRGGLHAIKCKHEHEEGACDVYSDVLPRHDPDDRWSRPEQQDPHRRAQGSFRSISRVIWIRHRPAARSGNPSNHDPRRCRRTRGPVCVAPRARGRRAPRHCLP